MACLPPPARGERINVVVKISAKVQILTLLLVIFAAVFICIACARMEQAAERVEEALDAPEPAVRPPVTETPAPEPEEIPGRGPKITAERAGMFESTEREVMALTANTPEIDDTELEMLACVIYAEAGGDACGDLCRQMVGDVVLNRVADPRFPGTMEEVLTQEGQYGLWHWTGVAWPERASRPGEAGAVERAYDAARDILEGNHSWIYGRSYIWEAEFPQGEDVVTLDGICFGR